MAEEIHFRNNASLLSVPASDSCLSRQPPSPQEASELELELADELQHRTSPRSSLSRASTSHTPGQMTASRVPRIGTASQGGRPATGAGRSVGLHALQDQVRFSDLACPQAGG